MTFVTEFQNTWSNPQLRHALIVHWPVVLSVLSVLFALGVALSGAKRVLLRSVALLICVGVMLTGYFALDSGENAEHSVSIADTAARDVLHKHEDLAEEVPLLGAICAGLMLISFIPKPLFRNGGALLGFAACAVTAGWVVNTAHYGGHLVYEYGVGTPLPAPPASPTPAAESSLPAASGDVHAIITEVCALCHNPERARRSGGLDQTSLAAILKGGMSGPALVPGHPEESLLIKRVKAEFGPDDVMPPPPNPPLSAEQIAALEQWIRELQEGI